MFNVPVRNSRSHALFHHDYHQRSQQLERRIPFQTVNLTVRASASYLLTELTCALLLYTGKISVNPRGGRIHIFFIYIQLVSLDYNASDTRLEIRRTDIVEDLY